MTVSRHAIASCLLLALASPGVWALDFLQAYDRALVHDARTRAARARADADREALPMARAQLLPNVSFNYGLSLNNQQRGAGTAFMQDMTFPSENKTVMLKQPIFRLNLIARYIGAGAAVEGAEATLEHEVQNLAVRVSAAYFDTLLSQEQMGQVAAEKDFYARQLESAQRAFAAGFGVRTDIDAVQADYDRTVAKEIEIRQLVDYNRQQLEYFVGEDVGALSGLNLAAFHPEGFAVSQLEDWVGRAAEVSPQVRALKAQMDVAHARILEARAAHLPTVDMVAQYSQSESDNPYFTGTRLENKSIGMQMNVPIFSGGYVNAAVREAVAEHEEARYKYEDALQKLRLGVRKEFNALKEGVAEIRALEQALKSGEQLVLSNTKSVEAGTRTAVDVLDAERRKSDAVVRLAGARYRFVQSWVALNAHVGAADAALIARLNESFAKAP